MTKEEFEGQNPILLKEKIERGNELKKEIEQQGKFFKNHTFILDYLNDKERQVIKLRYGIDSDKCLTQRDVAKILGITAERVRQLETIALDKLRHPARIMLLMRYTDDTFDLEKVNDNITLIRQSIRAKQTTIITTDEQEQLIKQCIINQQKENEIILNKIFENYVKMPIEILKFDTRVYNALKRSDINTIGDMVTKGLDFKDVWFLSNKGQERILIKLKQIGITKKSIDDNIENPVRFGTIIFDNILISEINFDEDTYHILANSGIMTLKDVVERYICVGFNDIKGKSKCLKQKVLNRLKEVGISLNNENIDITRPEQVLITDLNLGNRAYNALINAGIETLEDLINFEGSLRSIHSLGKKSKEIIEDKLYQLGVVVDFNKEENQENINTQSYDKILVDSLGFSTRVNNVLINSRIKTLEDLIIAQYDINWVSSLKITIEQEIVSKLNELGIKLDTDNLRL